MKKIISIFLSIFVVIGISILCVSVISKYLDNEIERLYKEKESSLSQQSGIPVKDKGNAWINESTKNGSLMVMGSSELTSHAMQNIKNNFPNEYYSNYVSCIGHGYVQNALHAINLGANSISYNGSDIVIIESLQWFSDNDIQAVGFMANFSELQFYEFLNNDSISEKNKQYICNRFLDIENLRNKQRSTDMKYSEITSNTFLSGLKNSFLLNDNNYLYDYPQTHILAKLYSSDNILDKFILTTLTPYYKLNYFLMRIKDKYETYCALKNLDSTEKNSSFNTNWDQQISKAQLQGESECTNNDIFVFDDYYTEYLSADWEQRKNSWVGMKLLDSNEWNDYKFLLSVCNDLGIKPYLINVSCNGYYYDYIGLDSNLRQKYYKQLENTANQYNIPIYCGLSEKEYEPFVYVDVMHLGWKGWIYTTKAILEHFTNCINSPEEANVFNVSSISQEEINNFKKTNTQISGGDLILIENNETKSVMLKLSMNDTKNVILAINGHVVEMKRCLGGYFYGNISNIDIGNATSGTVLCETCENEKFYIESTLIQSHDILEFETMSKGASLLNDKTRQYSLKTSIDNNKFSYALIQIQSNANDKVLDPVLIKYSEGKDDAIRHVYTHESPSGKYTVRFRGNSNLNDEYIQFECFLEEGTTYYCNFDVEKFTDTELIIGNLYFGEIVE